MHTVTDTAAIGLPARRPFAPSDLAALSDHQLTDLAERFYGSPREEAGPIRDAYNARAEAAREQQLGLYRRILEGTPAGSLADAMLAWDRLPEQMRRWVFWEEHYDAIPDEMTCDVEAWSFLDAAIEERRLEAAASAALARTRCCW